MSRPLPVLAVFIGLAGLIPFIGCTLGATLLTSDWQTRALLALSAYGSVILAFLGGVHWGFALSDGQAEQARIGLGVLPSLVGWLGLLVTFLGLPTVGLAITATGFAALTIVEFRAMRVGLIPRGYMGLRLALSAVVITCLVTVCLVRTLGGPVVL